MKKTMTIALAASMLTLALAASPKPALATSKGTHIKNVTIEEVRSTAQVPQWLQIIATVLGL